MIAAGVLPCVQVALARSQPAGTVSATAKTPGTRSGNDFEPLPAVVAIEKPPSVWLVKPKVPSPPAAVLLITIEPRWTFVNVQVTVTPAASAIDAGVWPWSQLAVVSQAVV